MAIGSHRDDHLKPISIKPVESLAKAVKLYIIGFDTWASQSSLHFIMQFALTLLCDLSSPPSLCFCRRTYILCNICKKKYLECQTLKWLKLYACNDAA